ncbi:unnamed protein product [Lactuca virosa]|uniref:RRM domain-containing protein n=1 Tax=Lactuca virosa TaxID=75947 RepID=A0AAU9N6D9_9ASTR|nr:unnamed protein product [Lactuca virosa]
MDVYFGMKKDYYKKNFAFVKLVWIKDAKNMENKLHGIKCRDKVLEVNIVKHLRKSNQFQTHETRQKTTERLLTHPCTSRGVSSQTPMAKDSRAFTQVTTGWSGRMPKRTTLLVVLNTNTHT